MPIERRHRGRVVSILFRVLGPITIGDGEKAVRLRVPKQRCLLATLLIETNEVVSLDRLAEELWGEQPPRSAVANLRSYPSALRRELAAAGIDQGRLVTVP